MAAKLVLYSKLQCPYCVRAKGLLKERSISFQEVMMDDRLDELKKLKEQYGHMTVPLIVFDGKLIGGFQELSQLDKEDELARFR